jgi:hypothetical protein
MKCEIDNCSNEAEVSMNIFVCDEHFKKIRESKCDTNKELKSIEARLDKVIDDIRERKEGFK